MRKVKREIAFEIFAFDKSNNERKNNNNRVAVENEELELKQQIPTVFRFQFAHMTFACACNRKPKGRTTVPLQFSDLHFANREKDCECVVCVSLVFTHFKPRLSD